MAARARLTLIGGGARSGKSQLALALAHSRGRRRVMLATAEAGDDEMAARIERHRADRGDDFRTVEEPHAVADVVDQMRGIDVLVLDCVTLWLSNRLCADVSDAAVEAELRRLAEVLGQRRFETIVVTNEVGLGLVPEGALGRRFRDLAGRAHRLLAAEADEVFFGAMGAMMRLRPGPVEAFFGDFTAVADWADATR